MAATSASPTPAGAPRIPAWKRLGLKLKYAKDPTDISADSSKLNDTGGDNKTPHSKKRILKDQSPEIPSKRSKPAFDEPTLTPKRYSSNSWDQPQLGEGRPKLPAPTGVFKAPNQAPKRIVFDNDEEPITTKETPVKQTRPSSLRKSVSFTPDTKQQDGFSAHNFFKAWAAGKNPAEVGKAKEIEPEAEAEATAPATQQEPKKEKPKKPKQKPSAGAKPEEPKTEDSTTQGTPKYIHYLQQYHTDRTNWKFNKNRQQELFKNLFDLSRTPAELDPAIIEYIAGLQGQARRRIAEQAEEVLKGFWDRENADADADAAAMVLDDPADRRHAYYEALHTALARYEASDAGRTQHSDQQLSEILREHQRGRRAEAILRRALNGEIFPDPNNPPPRAATAATAAARTGESFAIPRATRVVESVKTGRGQVTTTEIDLTKASKDAKAKQKRKARVDAPSSSSDSTSSSSSDDDSSSSASSDSDSSSGDSSTSPRPSKRPKKPSPTSDSDSDEEEDDSIPNVFETSLLDRKFGKSKPGS